MGQAVDLKIIDDEIAVVVMQDRKDKNTFSPPFIEDLNFQFDRIRKNRQLKVVVIHGVDNIFCAGGTRDELLGILEGRITFNDLNFYRVLLDCELPTIAAMQGHAIGGGFVFGLYADIIIMAMECVYSTNFMTYGFTPGMGATLIVPEKLGLNLANEMLFSAASYQGGKLKERGVSFKVVKKTGVIDEALSLAAALAKKPRESLKLLKRQMSGKILAQLPGTVRQELEMHKISFAQPEVREMIEALYV